MSMLDAQGEAEVMIEITSATASTALSTVIVRRARRESRRGVPQVGESVCVCLVMIPRSAISLTAQASHDNTLCVAPDEMFSVRDVRGASMWVPLGAPGGLSSVRG